MEAIFKAKENDKNVLQSEKLDEFLFHKVVEKGGMKVGIFYGQINTGMFPHFTKHIYCIDSDGYEIVESQKSECLDGVWVTYGKPKYKRGRKIF